MRRLSVLALAIAIAVVSHGRAHAQVSAEQVRQSIQRGVDYLKQTQNSDRGSPRFGSWGPGSGCWEKEKRRMRR